MWIHWNKATNLFHAEEVSRILSFPAPRLNDLVRIDMKDYALCYQFPSSPTGFQNFAMWPLFTCLSIPNIVGVIEAALSPTRRIIFTSHYPAMLTVAAETVRFCTGSPDKTYVKVGQRLAELAPQLTAGALTIEVVPTAGSLRVAGLDPSRQRTELAQRIGVVFGQRTTLWWDLPLRDSFELLRKIYRIPDARYRENLVRFVELLDLGAQLDTPVR